MHIPDNYLSPSSCAVLGAAMIPVWAVSIKKVSAEITKSKMPLLGIGAAFSFLIMMFNIPLPGGTTGHAVGGTLLAILLGPWSACISITIALFVQALLFGDGGILAFGANCFNLAFILPFTGYMIYSFISRMNGKRSDIIGMSVGSYIGLNIAALFAAIEFGIQPLLFTSASGLPLYSPYPLAISLPAMIIPHLLVAGFVESVFTVAIVTFVRKVSPSVIHEGEKKLGALYLLLIGLVVLTPLGLLASGTAWGEWGADEIGKVITGGKELGFTPEGMTNGFSFKTLIPDYTLNGVPETIGYIISALVGVIILVILFKIIGAMMRGKKSEMANKKR